MQVGVTKLLSLDCYRDGGSVSAAFSSEDPAAHYCLFFKVDTRSLNAERAYSHAELQVSRPAPYVSKATEKSIPNWETETNPITWAAAQILLAAMKPYMSGFQSEYLWVYDEMISAAAAKGRTIEP